MTAFVTICVQSMETAVQMQTPLVIITVSTHCIPSAMYKFKYYSKLKILFICSLWSIEEFSVVNTNLTLITAVCNIFPAAHAQVAFFGPINEMLPPSFHVHMHVFTGIRSEAY